MFEIIDVTEWQIAQTIEAIGTRPKQWLLDADDASWLFKEARSDDERPSGQDWAEKAVAELAQLLGVAVATVELAHWRGRRRHRIVEFCYQRGHARSWQRVVVSEGPHLPARSATEQHSGIHSAGHSRRTRALRGSLRRKPSVNFGIREFLRIPCARRVGEQHRQASPELGDRPRSQQHARPQFRSWQFARVWETDANRSKLLSGGDETIQRWLRNGRTKSFEDMPSMLDVVLAGWEYLQLAERTLWIDRLTNLRDDDVDEVLDRIPADGPTGVVLSDVSRTLCREILRINRLRLLDALTTH